MTWVYGEVASGADVSELELRLSSTAAGSTVLELEHTAIVPDDAWALYGPGAVGVGWEQGLLGLSLHLGDESAAGDPAWQSSQEGRDYARRSSAAWGEANIAAGADPVRARRHEHEQFYAPGPDAAP